MKQLTSLRNQILIAMPQLQDSWFEGTVIYLCDHDENGAMGLVLNKHLDINFDRVCEQLELFRHDHINPPMMAGGPVGTEQGFILHREPGRWQATRVFDAFAHLTTSKDILEAIAKGEGPADYRLALGYSGWSEGQLDNEILENSWLNVEPDAELLYRIPPEQLYEAALAKLGVNLMTLSDESGHA